MIHGFQHEVVQLVLSVAEDKRACEAAVPDLSSRMTPISDIAIVLFCQHWQKIPRLLVIPVAGFSLLNAIQCCNPRSN